MSIYKCSKWCSNSMFFTFFCVKKNSRFFSIFLKIFWWKFQVSSSKIAELLGYVLLVLVYLQVIVQFYSPSLDKPFHELSGLSNFMWIPAYVFECFASVFNKYGWNQHAKSNKNPLINSNQHLCIIIVWTWLTILK